MCGRIVLNADGRLRTLFFKQVHGHVQRLYHRVDLLRAGQSENRQSAVVFAGASGHVADVPAVAWMLGGLLSGLRRAAFCLSDCRGKKACKHISIS